MGYQMKGSPAKMGTIQGTVSHASALKQKVIEKGTTTKYSVFKTSFRCSQLISRIYRVLLGEEDLPVSERSTFYNNKSYTDKVYNKAIDDMIKDKDR